MAAETAKGVIITIGADTKEFEKGLRKMDREIRTTSKETNALVESLKYKWDDKTFIEAQKSAQKALDSTNTKAKSLRDQMKYLEENGGNIDSESYRKLQTQLVQTEASAVKLKKELQDLQTLKFENLANKFNTAGSAITKAGQSLALFSAAAVGALAGTTALFNSTVKAAAQIDDLSQAVNLSAEQLQRWQYIANQLGVDNTTLQTALAKTQGSFANLAQGVSNTGSKALERLGFSASDAAKGMGANFESMIQRLSGIPDAAEQAYLANEIFGERLGSKVIPLLNGGAEGIAALTKEFEELGYMTNEQVKTLATYDDQWLAIKTAFTSIKNDISISLLPLFQTLTNLLQEKIIPAVRNLADRFADLSDKTKENIAITLTVVAALAPVLLILGKMTTGIGSLIGSLGGLSKALTFLMAHPIIAAIAAIVGVMVLLYTTNEKVRESINGIISTIGKSLAPILQMLGDLFNQIITAVAPLITMIGDLLVPILDMIGPILEPIMELLQAAMIPIMAILSNNIQMFMAILKPVIAILQLVLVPVMALIQKSIGFITQLIQPLKNALMGLAPVFNFIFNLFQAGLALVEKGINFVIKGIETVINKGIDMINHLIRAINSLGGWLGISLKELNHIRIGVETGTSIQPINEPVTQSPAQSAQNALNSTYGQGINNSYNTVTTTDNSVKTNNITVTIQNYAAEINTDELVREINTKLAEAM